MAKIKFDEYIAKINTLISAEQFNQAEQHCNFLIRQFPKNVRIYLLLGRIYMETERNDFALDLFLRILSADSQNLLALVSLAYLAEIRNDEPAAYAFLFAAHALYPANEDVMSDLLRLGKTQRTSDALDFFHGIQFLDAENYQDSLRCFEKVSSGCFSNLAEPFRHVCRICHAKSPELRKLETEKALRTFPCNILILKLAGLDCMRQKNYLKLSKITNRLAEINWCEEVADALHQFIEPEMSTQIVNYQEWTGVPLERVKIGRQADCGCVYQLERTALPNWLNYIPIATDYHMFCTSNQSIQNMQRFVFRLQTNETKDKNFQVQTDDAPTMPIVNPNFYADGIMGKRNEISCSEAERTTKNPPKNALDSAFSLLEKVASDGLFVSDGEFHLVDLEPVLTKDADQVQSKALREAWNCFGKNEIDRGTKIYYDFLEKQILPERVVDDLRKLTILFPDNLELKKMLLKGELLL